MIIVTRGYGNGTFAGSIGDVVTRGYAQAVDDTPRTERLVIDNSNDRLVVDNVYRSVSED